MTMPDSTPEGSEGEYSLDEEDQLQPEDTLVDRGVDDVLDEGYSPPERPLGLDAYGTTAAEQREGETLDQRLAEEEPDPALEDDNAEILDDNEVGRLRSGRLVAEDEGVGEDEEKDLVASDIGIDGGAASAEEAAVHIVDEETDFDELS
ncbi:DUF5709 domain-containing protein [Rhodococcus opacus]|uniref:DUF5709 domain-containing protein n=2 Tax=Rhodococcus opacus TaxID=37919 RepID=A0AAX3YDG8_RHOOP|nr:MULTISPECIES: DUF5709 domain-containing protein [Rhodococcus]ELB93347.1 hypothetical protein Rwratislav_09623 [Rhodococcus wratislaviensis IFP 2016]NDV05719.1 hypothetical protein [Rhodococcus sp. IEGM 248]MCZ4589748.1 DUF5709 domain-containing protein [Rhodococcus opacus]MDI9936691.1 DUF5709 domain-containing protein [Rhodococcus sp. IEGM 1351]MDJ0413263.1 DUF5709 domain-containing protein [Rhodococcus opacus]